MTLHDYQQLAVDQIKDHFRNNVRSVLLHLATGGGKTVIFSHILKQTAANGKRGMMAVRGRKLVDQASKTLFKQDVPHGVRMSGHWNDNRLARTQVCSIDTLLAREEFPETDLLVIDEGHMWTSDKSKEFLKVYRDRGTFILAVTATPYTKKPLAHIADQIVKPITVQQLMDRGYLVPPRYFAPSTPNMKGVKTVNGDWDTRQTMERMTTLTGDLPTHWKKFAQGRPTATFAVNVEHSQKIVAQYLREGIRARHIDAESSDSEREDAIEELRTGRIDVLSNVGILCTGVDMPWLGCIQMARPTQSLNLYIQVAGRGTRTFPGKENFILLDHAGNVARHGYITEDHEATLDEEFKRLNIHKGKTCMGCYNVYFGTRCDQCEYIEEKSLGVREQKVEVLAGELVELKPGEKASNLMMFIAEKNTLARRRGYKSGWVYHEVSKEFGEDVANKMFPKQAKKVSSWRKPAW